MFRNAPNFGFGYNYQVGQNKNIQDLMLMGSQDLKKEDINTPNRLGLRLQTFPTNVKMETMKRIHERMVAMQSPTFISYARYTGQVTNKDRDVIKQLHE